MAVLSALGQARDTALLESVTLSPLGTGDAPLVRSSGEGGMGTKSRCGRSDRKLWLRRLEVRTRIDNTMIQRWLPVTRKEYGFRK